VKRLLIVDDQQGIRLLLNEVLKKEGYITYLAANGSEALKYADEQEMDCDEEALVLAQKLNTQFIPFAAIASEAASGDNPLADLAYTYVSTRIKGGLIPNDLGQRIVVPHALAGLFVYEAVKIAYDEMLGLDEEEL